MLSPLIGQVLNSDLPALQASHDVSPFPGGTGVGANCLVRSTDFTYSYELNQTDEPYTHFFIFEFLLSRLDTNGNQKKRICTKVFRLLNSNIATLKLMRNPKCRS